MGYKVKSTTEDATKDIFDKLSELGITIELPNDEDDSDDNSKKEKKGNK